MSAKRWVACWSAMFVLGFLVCSAAAAVASTSDRDTRIPDSRLRAAFGSGKELHHYPLAAASSCMRPQPSRFRILPRGIKDLLGGPHGYRTTTPATVV